MSGPDPDAYGAWGDPPGDEGVELVGDAGPGAVDGEGRPHGDPDVDALDDEGELLGRSVEHEPETGPLAPDDEFSGDETTRDYPTEDVPPAAEDAAVHIDDELPGGT